MRTETNLSIAGAMATQVMQVVSSDYVVLTFIPAVLGATIYTVNKARQEKLTRADIIIAFAIALPIGAYGGPWFAEIMPATHKALPLMCFVSGLFAKDVATWVRGMLEAASKSIGDAIAEKIGRGKDG